MTTALTPNERKLDLLERSVEAGANDQARILRDILLKTECRAKAIELCKNLPPKKQ